MSRTQKLKGLVVLSLGLKTLKDNPYFRDLKVSFWRFSERFQRISKRPLVTRL